MVSPIFILLFRFWGVFFCEIGNKMKFRIYKKRKQNSNIASWGQ